MKKLVSILLALAMIFAMSITAFADNDTQLTLSDANDRTYNGYQLLTLSISEKPEGQHECAADGSHTDKCYNYRYEIKAQYLNILKEETYNYGINLIWTEDTKPASANDVTADQVIKYLEKHTSDEGTATGNMRQVADRIYRAIQKQTDPAITPEKENAPATTTVEQGYWLFADITNFSGEYDANSLVFVDTKGANDLVIKPKVSVPTLEKKVKDIEDSEDDNILDNPWYDSADHDIGDDKIPFKLTATLPSNYMAFHRDVTTDGVTTNVQYYTMVFHDEMEGGLVLNTGSVKVYQYENKGRADVDTDLNNFVNDVTGFFTVTEDLNDDCSFEVRCDNIFAIPGLTADTAFVVYYEAALENTAEHTAVIGSTGNINRARLEFSNDPYGTTTGFTEYDKVTVFTYALEILKTDAQGNALPGASFKLFKKNVDGVTYTELAAPQIEDNGTKFTWEGLDDGDYKLEETTPPAGYNAVQNILFSISAAHSETADEPELVTLDGGAAMDRTDKATGVLTRTVVNTTGIVLPETGAQGTFLLIACGTLLVVVACVFMITRKKMSIYED